MLPRVFFEVPESAYLFKRTITPEEKVRQWALFELLSTYGVHINDIEIEKPVKVGTRTHRADIIISQNQVPYIVIECKRQEEDDLSSCLDQAISYASADSIKAEYAICTNSLIWAVRRKVERDWVIVPDIPPRIRQQVRCTNLLDFVHISQSLMPLLYWLYRPVPKEYAQYFLGLHNFFASYVIFMEDVNPILWDATESLLRVHKHDVTLMSPYSSKKMQEACKGFISYFTSIGVESQIQEPLNFYDETRSMTSLLLYNFSELAKNSYGLRYGEARFIRFITSLLQYLMHASEAGEYLDIPITLVNEFKFFIEWLCENRLGVVFPDDLDELVADVENLCESAWKELTLP
jgi:hypothetical protein